MHVKRIIILESIVTQFANSSYWSWKELLCNFNEPISWKDLSHILQMICHIRWRSRGSGGGSGGQIWERCWRRSGGKNPDKSWMLLIGRQTQHFGLTFIGLIEAWSSQVVEPTLFSLSGDVDTNTIPIVLYQPPLCSWPVNWSPVRFFTHDPTWDWTIVCYSPIRE